MEAFRIDLQCKYRRFKNAQSGFEHSRVLEAALKSKHAMWCMCQRAGGPQLRYVPDAAKYHMQKHCSSRQLTWRKPS